jgi:long-chain acyl-CoA synthetase
MAYLPLTHRFLEAADRDPDGVAQMVKAGDAWQPTPRREMLRRVAALAEALAGMGVAAGDRVALFCPNRPEWHVVDFAVLGLGAADVPIYFNESPERLCYIVNHSGAKVVVAVGEEQSRRLMECRAQLGAIERVILGDAPADLAGDFLRLEEILARGTDAAVADYRRRAAEARPEMLASILYTSGTTGEPKGVMLTHNNLSSNATDSCVGMDFYPSDIGLSFLPLSHVYERLIDYVYFFNGIPVAYVPKMDHLAAAMREVRPTLAASVPRVFEKVYAGIQEKAAKASGLRRALFQFAMRAAKDATPWRGYGRRVGAGVRLRWHIANRLVYPKIRAALGGRIRRFNSGAAPLALHLLEFFWSVGVPIYQGYGLTETSPVVSTNNPRANKLGTVGKPIPYVEVRLAEDGEIIVRGPCVMQGYYKKPEETRAVLDDAGWFATGDVGRLDDDGYLVITDRKKDLIKTAAGKFVAPQPIENRLKASPLVLNAAVLGDRRKFCVALVVPHFANLTARAAEAGLEFRSNAELAAHPWVRQQIQQEIDRLNATLAQYETVKRFALLDHDFSFEDGQLTYTMKLKRRVVEQRYAEVIEALYAETEAPAAS